MPTQRNEVITQAPDILGGTPVFRGTRVPFPAWLDYLEGGQTLDAFLEDFPTVTRETAVRRWNTRSHSSSVSCTEPAARRMSRE
jgi:uncharacterized protein (DUF433 family)